MSLKETIKSDIVTALKAGDELTTTTLRNAIAEIERREMAGKQRVELSDVEILAAIKGEINKRRETAKIYQDAGESARADREQAEAEVLVAYVPSDLERAEVEAIIEKAFADTGASTMADMGVVMKQVTAEVAGRYSGKEISDIVRSKLA